MYPFRPDPVVRIRVPAPGGEEPRSYRQQPHPPSTVAAVRALVEGSRLPFRVIGERTGVHSGTISRWTEKHQWQRPPGAAASTRRPPGTRYVPVLLGRALSQRLRIQAERLVSDIERAPQVDPAALAEALDLLARAREAQQVRRGRRLMPPPNPPEPARPRKRRPSLHDRRAAALKGWSTRWSRQREHHARLLERDPGPPRGPAGS